MEIAIGLQHYGINVIYTLILTRPSHRNHQKSSRLSFGTSKNERFIAIFEQHFRL